MKITKSSEFRVRFNETDPLGIVWHGYYITYFEDGREDFGREYGISYLDIKSHGFVTPIVESSCKHKRPLKYGDLARIETTFEDSPAAKMIYKFKIFNPEGELACVGKTIQVFVSHENELSLNTPKFFADWKARMHAENNFK